MDDQINEKIKNIISDPESLKSIMSVVSALGLNNSAGGYDVNKTEIKETEESVELAEESNIAGQTTVPLAPSAAQALSSLSGIGNKSNYTDNRVNLLLSIKPFLSERKRQRVDSLIKALGAAKLISSYKELDILSKFL